MTPSSYLHPIDLEITNFNLLKPDTASSGAASSTSKREIDLQVTVTKNNPKEKLVKELLSPVLASATRLRGTAVHGDKHVTFPRKQNRVRLEYWNKSDFLVVNMEALPSPKNLGKVVAFNIGDVRDGLLLEVAGHFALKVVVRRAPPPTTPKVNWVFLVVASVFCPILLKILKINPKCVQYIRLKFQYCIEEQYSIRIMFKINRNCKIVREMNSATQFRSEWGSGIKFDKLDIV